MFSLSFFNTLYVTCVVFLDNNCALLIKVKIMSAYDITGFFVYGLTPSPEYCVRTLIRCHPRVRENGRRMDGDVFVQLPHQLRKILSFHRHEQ